jgi:hypothetical protein
MIWLLKNFPANNVIIGRGVFQTSFNLNTYVFIFVHVSPAFGVEAFLSIPI